jgi:hypothetical protein
MVLYRYDPRRYDEYHRGYGTVHPKDARPRDPTLNADFFWGIFTKRVEVHVSFSRRKYL